MRLALYTVFLRVPSFYTPFILYGQMKEHGFNKPESILAGIIAGTILYGVSLIPEELFKKSKKKLDELLSNSGFL